MKVIEGHLTEKDKQAINSIIASQWESGKVGRKSYFLTANPDGTMKVKMLMKDRGLLPVPGSALRISTYYATVKL